MSSETTKKDITLNRPGFGPGPGRGKGNIGMPVEKPVDGKKSAIRLVGYLKQERLLGILLLLFVTGAVITTVMAPGFQSKAIDVIASGEYESLFIILVHLVFVYVGLGICTLFQSRISAIISQNIVGRMRSDLFSKVIRLPISYLDKKSHGDIMSRMTNDVENISNTVSQSLSAMLSGILTIIGTVGMMFWYCWQLALLSCSTVVITVLTTRYLSKKLAEFYRKRQQLLGQLNGTAEEMISGYQTVVAYNRQAPVMQEFEQTANELTKTGIHAEILAGSMGPLMNSINNTGFVIIAAFGGYFAYKGIISIGVISAFIIYAKQFGRPINELAQLYGQLQTAIAGAERVFAVLDENDEDQGGTEHLSKKGGRICFEHVDFSYLPGKQVLYDFDLDIPPGHKVALVGATGSGKTTVVNLLMRFYDIDAGRILIDGKEIRDIQKNELRRTTGIVLQDAVLFTDTVKNNLNYSNPEIEDSQIRHAAQMSYCDSMIQMLPQGYDTILQEAGNQLSQGQRQLMTIARAFLADPGILILDEATSSVDTRTEKHIQDAMVNLMKDRTSLIIAHRLSTIRDADMIVVMEKGRIVETGNHEELLQKQGTYFRLYQTQFEGKAT